MKRYLRDTWDDLPWTVDNSWGCPTVFYEVGEDGWVTRQGYLFPNGHISGGV